MKCSKCGKELFSHWIKMEQQDIDIDPNLLYVYSTYPNIKYGTPYYLFCQNCFNEMFFNCIRYIERTETKTEVYPLRIKNKLKGGD